MAYIITFVLTIVGSIIVYFAVNPKSRIIWSSPYNRFFTPRLVTPDGEKDPVEVPFNFYVRQYWLKNFGRGSAERVELIFNFKPEYYFIWPASPYEEIEHPDKRFTVRISTVGKKEEITCDVLGRNELPILLRVRTEKGDCLEHPLILQLVPAKWIMVILYSLLFIGSFVIILGAVKFGWPLIQYILNFFSQSSS